MGVVKKKITFPFNLNSVEECIFTVIQSLYVKA